MKKDTFYFSHDYNSAIDTKILFLRQQLGMEGYGIYWYLVESLANSGGYLPFKIIPVLAMQMQVPEIKVKAVIDGFELFKIFEGSFYSERLNQHLDLRKILSEKGIEGAKKRWNQISYSPPIALPNGNPNAKESKVKENKVNESKEKKQKDLCFEILEYFGFNEMKHPNKLFDANGFLNSLGENLEQFIHQFKFYKLYKSESKEKIHSFPAFIDKGWEQENWEKKYNDCKKEESGVSRETANKYFNLMKNGSK